MTQGNDFTIGQTRVNAGFTKKKWFYLKPGNNFFRVLPPLHSLAAAGVVGKYYATHRCFRDTNNKQRSFRCIQEKDKNKLITAHCPICDLHSEREIQYKEIKDSNQYSKEQLQKWGTEYCFNYKREMRYFLNAISVDGEIGILSIPITAWESFKQLLNEQFERQYDPTGMNGCFINFQKVQAYKGDFNTSYKAGLAVEQYQDENGVPQQKVKMSPLTPDIINRLKTETSDLDGLFTVIDSEKMATLLQLKGADQAKQLEAFMSPPEKQDPDDPTKINIPNTNAQAVVTASIDQNGQFQASSIGDTRNQAPTVPQPAEPTPIAEQPIAAPTMPAPSTPAAPPTPAIPADPGSIPLTAPSAAIIPKSAPSAPPPDATTPIPANLTPAPPAPSVGIAQVGGMTPQIQPAEMSDDDFIKTFQPPQ